MKPRIGIGSDIRTQDNRRRYVVATTYAEAVAVAGGIPVLLPPLQTFHDEYLSMMDGILIPGGGDLSPGFTAVPPTPGATISDDQRSASDLAFCLLAMQRKVPFLGVCLGMQTLNVALGGTLIQDLPSGAPDGRRFRDHDGPDQGPPLYHELKVEPSSLLAGILGFTRGEVNSFHHQGVDRLGQGLTAAAWSEDGLVEAVLGPGPFCVGVQWHPERNASAPHNRKLFGAFVEAASRFRQARKA